jgi:hypothetical protein
MSDIVRLRSGNVQPNLELHYLIHFLKEKIMNTQNTNTSIATCSIQNVSATVETYVEQFNQFSRKTAENIIGMAETIYQAKKNLVKTTGNNKLEKYNEFLAGIRYHSKSSAVRKLLQIGEMADMLKRHSDQLPNTWTTLYTLTQLGQETLERLISEQLVIASVTAKQAQGLLEEYGDKSANDSEKSAADKKADKPADAQVDDNFSLTVILDQPPTINQAVMLDKIIRDLLTSLELQAQVTRSKAMDALLIEDSSRDLKAA